MEHIGSTEVNLSNYSTIQYVDDQVLSVSDHIDGHENSTRYRCSATGENIVQIKKNGYLSPLSPVTHQLDVTVTNPESTITVLGKNLLPCYNVNAKLNGVSFTSNPDGSLEVQGTAESEILTTFSEFINNFSVHLPQGRYLFAILIEEGTVDGINAIGIRSESDAEVAVASFESGSIGDSSGFTLESADTVWLGMHILPNSTIDVVLRFQIGMYEGSGAFPELSPYIPPTVYTPDSDGKVKGIKSLYPATTLISNIDGNNITVGYNKARLERDEYVQALLFKQSSESSSDDLAAKSEIVLLDTVTNIPYKLCITNGKLTMEEVTE
jgi:hypothetical protein